MCLPCHLAMQTSLERCHSNYAFLIVLVGRDGGDCSSVFSGAGDQAFQECDRALCSHWFEEYAPTSAQSCQSECFTASCDWSRSMCSKERASLATCPLFDAAVLQSTTLASANRTLRFVVGGTARFARYLPRLRREFEAWTATNTLGAGATAGATTRPDACRRRQATPP